MRHARQAVLTFISTFVLSGQASGEPLRLEETSVPACAVEARELRPRIERALGGSLPNELEASVAIEVYAEGYRVGIALRDRSEARGTTVIEAPTCDEAVDAAAVVLALAFGKATPREVERSRETTEFGSFGEPVRVAPSEPPPSRDTRPAPLDRAPARDSENATRITLATGVDGGTLPQPTLMLAGALVRPLGNLELATIARYGLPVADERVENDFSESRRHDFAALELRACGAVGDAVRVSACSGTEVGAVRARRSREGESGSDLDTDIAPRLSGTLSTLVTHRGGLVEPGLELGAAAVALGREAEAPWLVVRVAASATIAF